MTSAFGGDPSAFRRSPAAAVWLSDSARLAKCGPNDACGACEGEGIIKGSGGDCPVVPVS